VGSPNHTQEHATMKSIFPQNLLVAALAWRADIHLRIGAATANHRHCRFAPREARDRQRLPTEPTIRKLYDDIDFQRACQAYLWGLPLIAMVQWQGEQRDSSALETSITWTT